MPLLFGISFGYAQNSNRSDSITCVGKVVDSSTNESIVFATIKISKNGKLVLGNTSDIQGKFKVKLPIGSYQYSISMVGYAQLNGTLKVTRKGLNPKLFKLSVKELDKEEVVIMYSPHGRKVKAKQIAKYGTRDLSSKIHTITSSSYNAASPLSTSSNEFKKLPENSYISTISEPVSTFSIDVDNASYAIVRQSIQQENRMPNPDGVRVEELINAFSYDYPKPDNGNPLNVNTELAVCPWDTTHHLLKVNMKAKEIDMGNAPSNNLVFLIDVSGSMSYENKLPLVKAGLKQLVAQLRPIDSISIVVYAGAAGLVLDATSGEEKRKIYDALDRLQSGGSTAGGAGINLAYSIAKKHFNKDGNNRIILCSDGDFNVGVTSETSLEELVSLKRKEGVFLSVLGFGMGNYKDNRMELLADKGNGNYAYIDNLNEAKKRLVGQMGGTLYTVAKDVKFQLEFNPFNVAKYRLIGYENRNLNNEDFKNDSIDAGDLGSGHCVTALYEIIPSDNDSKKIVVDRKYSSFTAKNRANQSNEIATVSVRYKEPKDSSSKELNWTVLNKANPFNKASIDMRFSASVASFGLILSHSKHAGKSNFEQIIQWTNGTILGKYETERLEFTKLVEWCNSNPDKLKEAKDEE
jgi:Ca-activated chloride channel family protein